MAENVHIHLALEIVGGEPFGVFHQGLVGDDDVVEHLVRLEETAVVGEYLVFLALEPCAHITEILLHAVV